MSWFSIAVNPGRGHTMIKPNIKGILRCKFMYACRLLVQLSVNILTLLTDKSGSIVIKETIFAFAKLRVLYYCCEGENQVCQDEDSWLSTYLLRTTWQREK